MPALENLGLSIKRLQHRNYHALNAGLMPLGISLVQWSALREIDAHPGLCMHRLAERTFNSDQAFGTLMARLLRQKLVERQPGAGRANLHRLTPRGQTLLAEGYKHLEPILSKVFAPLDAGERTQLQALLSKVLGDDPDAPACHLAQEGSPMTSFVKTLAGLVPNPGRATVRASGPATKPAARRTGRPNR